MEQGSVAQRGLLAAVIGMGLLIVVGTGALVAVVIHRMSHPVTHALNTAPLTVPDWPTDTALTLHEPAGTRIAGMAWRDGRVMAVQLTGGSLPDRIVLWDIPAGQIAGRFRVAPAP